MKKKFQYLLMFFAAAGLTYAVVVKAEDAVDRVPAQRHGPVRGMPVRPDYECRRTAIEAARTKAQDAIGDREDCVVQIADTVVMYKKYKVEVFCGKDEKPTFKYTAYVKKSKGHCVSAKSPEKD